MVGGGNTAVEEALFLTNFASKVTLIHRRDELRAEKILIDRLMKNEKIVPMWFHEIDEVYGTDMPLGVEGVKVKHTKTGEITDVPCKGVFVAIGHAPANELVKDVLETHMGGYVVTQPDSTATSIPWCVCRRRSDRSQIPPSRHQRRNGLYGSARSRTVFSRSGLTLWFWAARAAQNSKSPQRLPVHNKAPCN